MFMYHFSCSQIFDPSLKKKKKKKKMPFDVDTILGNEETGSPKPAEEEEPEKEQIEDTHENTEKSEGKHQSHC